MIEKIQLNTHNITLINFYSIVTECELDIINDLYQYDMLLPLSFKVKDTKKVFYFYIIKKILEVLITSHDKNKLIFYFNENDIPLTEITQYCTKYSFKSFIKTIARKLNQLFPLKIYFYDLCFREFENITGEVKDIIMKVQYKSRSFKIENYTFSKIKAFTQKYELTYLDKEYFDQVKVKSIMYK